MLRKLFLNKESIKSRYVWIRWMFTWLCFIVLTMATANLRASAVYPCVLRASTLAHAVGMCSCHNSWPCLFTFDEVEGLAGSSFSSPEVNLDREQHFKMFFSCKSSQSIWSASRALWKTVRGRFGRPRPVSAGREGSGPKIGGLTGSGFDFLGRDVSAASTSSSLSSLSVSLESPFWEELELNCK